MEAKKKFVAVIGDQNSGKSTVIQALTGCRNAAFRGRMEEKTSGKWIEVIASSPQEKDIRDLAERIKAATSDSQCLGVVIALQPNHPRNREKRPWIEDVFDLAKKSRMARYAFVISEPYDRKKSDAIEVAEIDKRLRNYGIQEPIQELDGRRFAHVNASKIAGYVAWF
jgi:energy-coupling factor transporter ATP-binding protein EcfA2